MRVEASAGRNRKLGVRQHVERLTLRSDSDEEAKQLAKLNDMAYKGELPELLVVKRKLEQAQRYFRQMMRSCHPDHGLSLSESDLEKMYQDIA